MRNKDKIKKLEKELSEMKGKLRRYEKALHVRNHIIRSLKEDAAGHEEAARIIGTYMAFLIGDKGVTIPKQDIKENMGKHKVKVEHTEDFYVLRVEKL